jgi:predicted house-cleaning noncanonical NTP pyrophosphatase (MazG superfamily)
MICTGGNQGLLSSAKDFHNLLPEKLKNEVDEYFFVMNKENLLQRTIKPSPD